MWFLLSLLSMAMLVSRRSAEKHASGKFDSLSLTWLQQAAALPFIIITLFFARFYWPSELSTSAWFWLIVVSIVVSVDVWLYFKALRIADVSYVAPLLTLVALGNIAGAYIVLGQVPSVFGVVGAGLIVIGAALTYHAKRRDLVNRHANKLALLLILAIVVMRGLHSNFEVFVLRETNPTTFNFYNSMISIPLIILASSLAIHNNKSRGHGEYWKRIGTDIAKYRWLLIFIGITYTIGALALFQAKLIGPNAGYVEAVRSASVLPVMLIGILFFKEKIVGTQWLGLGFIAAGLVFLALN